MQNLNPTEHQSRACQTPLLFICVNILYVTVLSLLEVKGGIREHFPMWEIGDGNVDCVNRRENALLLYVNKIDRMSSAERDLEHRGLMSHTCQSKGSVKMYRLRGRRASPVCILYSSMSVHIFHSGFICLFFLASSHLPHLLLLVSSEVPICSCQQLLHRGTPLGILTHATGLWLFFRCFVHLFPPEWMQNESLNATRWCEHSAPDCCAHRRRVNCTYLHLCVWLNTNLLISPLGQKNPWCLWRYKHVSLMQPHTNIIQRWWKKLNI